MRFKVNTKRMCEALTLAGGVVPKGPIQPLLEDVKIVVTGKGLRVSATDLEKYITTRVKNDGEKSILTVTEDGEIAVPAQELNQILRETPDDEIEISTEGEKCLIVTSDSRFAIHCDKVDEFPDRPPTPTDGALLISCDVLSEMLGLTAFSAAKEAMRYALNSILLVAKLDRDKIEMVGADGRRLAHCNRKAVANAPADMRVMIPINTLDVIRKVLDGASGGTSDLAMLRWSGDMLWLTVGETEIATRLVDGNYPNYKDVIPTDLDTTVELDRTDFQSAVRRASIVNTKETNAVSLAFSEKTLRVYCETSERGAASVDLAVDYSGSEVTMKFNPEYLIQMLRAVDSDTVTMEFKDGKSATILRGGERYLYLLMPITEAE